MLDHDQAKRIVLAVLNSQLEKQHARCIGFVIMPNHVHALVWFPEPNQLSVFMKQWKQRSSYGIKQLQREHLVAYASTIPSADPVWQRKYHAFQIDNERKLQEKLDYMHLNPVRAGLVDQAADWAWSSARWYLQGKSVGVPLEWVD